MHRAAVTTVYASGPGTGSGSDSDICQAVLLATTVSAAVLHASSLQLLGLAKHVTQICRQRLSGPICQTVDSLRLLFRQAVQQQTL